MQGFLATEKMVKTGLIKSNSIKRCLTAIDYLLNQLCPIWEIIEDVVLESLAGGPTQEVHRDIPIDVVNQLIAKSGYPPVGINSSLMQTSLRVFNGNALVLCRKLIWRDIMLNSAQCIVFRGDLAHCGMAYNSTNICIHFVIVTQGFRWAGNESHPVVIKSYHCEFCGMAFTYGGYFARHRDCCKKNPNWFVMSKYL